MIAVRMTKVWRRVIRLAVGVLGITAAVQAHGSIGESIAAPAERAALERRVDAVRRAHSRLHDIEAPLSPVAQWPNWPNWGNWANWPNWGKWANWYNR